MTAMVASMIPAHGGFGDFASSSTNNEDYLVATTTKSEATTNDSSSLPVHDDGVPCSYGLVETTDDDNNSMGHVSTESSSTIPSLNDFGDDDDDLVLEMENEILKAKSFGGLQNLGNTCYLNSALQMIASLDSFTALLKVNKCHPENDTLRELLVDILSSLEKGETVHPSNLKQFLDQRTCLFQGYRQQDSHELLTTLIDFLDEDYKKACHNDQEMQDATTSTQRDTTSTTTRALHDQEQQVAKKPRVDFLSSSGSFKDLKFHDIEHLLHGTTTTTSFKEEAPAKVPLQCKLVGGRMDTTGMSLTPFNNAQENTHTNPLEKSPTSSTPEKQNPVDSQFTTQVQVCLTCDSCKYRRSHTETFLHLSLEISDSVEESLKKFVAPERRQVKCEKCFAETALQTTEIVKLAKFLLLHLKRFIVKVSPDYSSISYTKNQSPVEFGQVLDFSCETLKELLQKETYEIRSIVHHIGSSASCGHYTCDALKNKEWTRFNDSYVSKLSNLDSNAATTGYMIMYELQENDDYVSL